MLGDEVRDEALRETGFFQRMRARGKPRQMGLELDLDTGRVRRMAYHCITASNVPVAIASE